MTRKIHTTRPKTIGGRVAWDSFTRHYGKPPVQMWFTYLCYPVWVAEWEDGETHDIDNLCLAYARARARKQKEGA
jgi:hypothetical protein